VIYNSFENCWYFGTLSRTAWLDSSSRDYPIGANSVDFKLYNHELGLNDGEGTSPSGISAYVESADFEIGEGDRFQFISMIIPDISFFGSTDPAPTATFSLKPRNFSGSAYGTSDTSTITGTKMVDVQEFTKQSYIRVRGRQVAFRVESSGTNIAWKLGVPRIDIRPDGRK
jgi:hypothetical protein